FTLSAVGQSSGLTAQTTFTDAANAIFPKKTLVGSAAIGMTVTGSGFASGGATPTRVLFGSNTYVPSSFTGSTKLLVTIPASEFIAAGSVNVSGTRRGAVGPGPVPVVNNTYLVDPAGTGGAYTTIQAALTDMSDMGPWVINVKPGTYVEALTMLTNSPSRWANQSGSDSQRVVLQV